MRFVPIARGWQDAETVAGAEMDAVTRFTPVMLTNHVSTASTTNPGSRSVLRLVEVTGLFRVASPLFASLGWWWRGTYWINTAATGFHRWTPLEP